MVGMRHCSSALCLMAVAGGLICGSAAASARSGQRAEAPTPLPVRYKAEIRGRPDKSPFALLAAFPEVVSRRPMPRDSEPATIRTRQAEASFMRRGGNPLPARSGVLSSSFGMRRHPLLGGWRPHHGVDIAAPMGTPVHATADGVVSAAGRRGGYGLSIALEHGPGLETRYGHMSRLNVARGQSVRRGNLIGWVGSTGLSTGPHLHYETRVRGAPVNPLPYMGRK